MKGFKKILSIVSGLLLVGFVVALWYMNTYSMDKAKAFEVHSPKLEKKLLIATQGSDFKTSITAGIIEYYEQDSIFIKVIDVSDLGDIDPKDFDALTIIHTWENWKPPKAVQSFIEKYSDEKNKMIVLTTSGEGSYKMGNVDAITGESILEEAPSITDKIITRITSILE